MPKLNSTEIYNNIEKLHDVLDGQKVDNVVHSLIWTLAQVVYHSSNDDALAENSIECITKFMKAIEIMCNGKDTPESLH